MMMFSRLMFNYTISKRINIYSMTFKVVFAGKCNICNTICFSLSSIFQHVFLGVYNLSGHF